MRRSESDKILNIVLKEYQEIKERVIILERRVSVCEEFKHKTHVGMYATTDDLKKLDNAIKDLKFGGSQ